MADENIELETRYTFLERTVNELSEVVYTQQKQIDQLQTTLRKLCSRLDELSANSGSEPPPQRPPHY